MISLVLSEFIPEALDIGDDLSRGGRPELVGGVLLETLLMLPLRHV